MSYLAWGDVEADPVVPSPPAASTWVLDDIVTRARTVLRLGAGDVDVARLEHAAASATRLVDNFVDSAEPLEPTATMLDAAVTLTVEQYRRLGATFGVIDSWSTDGVGPIRIPSDVMRGVETMLQPDKQRWAVA